MAVAVHRTLQCAGTASNVAQSKAENFGQCIDWDALSWIPYEHWSGADKHHGKQRPILEHSGYVNLLAATRAIHSADDAYGKGLLTCRVFYRHTTVNLLYECS